MKDGGPAFPVAWAEREGEKVWGQHAPGMSIRDYFAGQALDRCIKSVAEGAQTKEKMDALLEELPDDLHEALQTSQAKKLKAIAEALVQHIHQVVARDAYTFADAMLKEREK